MPPPRYLWLTLLALAIALGIAPVNRSDWLIENVVVAGTLAGMLGFRRHLNLSLASWWMLAIFLLIHETGAHYTYSRVPYDAAWQALTGERLNELLGWRRNNFDRFVHLGYGLLLQRPLRELLMRNLRLGWTAAALLALSLILATSAIYEMAEWIGGEFLGGDQSAAFVAAQNDKWDAQKDMALAMLGALLVITGEAFQAWLHGAKPQA